MNSGFWKNRKILVTGHTGFVGTWLSMVLDSFGADLYGLALPPEEMSLYTQVSENLHIEDIICDLRDKPAVDTAISRIKPEIVIHLASFGFIQECYNDPERTFSTNVDGTVNLLRSITEADSVRSLVVASSDKVYKNSEDGSLFSEESPLGGDDPYSASKTCQDLTVTSWYNSYLADKDIGMCVVRPSNILGGGDHHENRLIPSIFRSLKRDKEIIIRNPNAVRPWQDILDMCDAYLKLAIYAYEGRDYSVFNVGPEPDGVKTVHEIADTVAGLYGLNDAVKIAKTDLGLDLGAPELSMTDSHKVSNAKEHGFLGLSIEKIEKELGWIPRYTLDDTLRNIYECYECENSDKIYEVCMRQIRSFFE